MRKLFSIAGLLVILLPVSALDLADLERMAEQTSPALLQPEIAREQGIVSVQEARARYWPTVDLSVSASYLGNPPEGISIKQGQLGSTPSPNSTFPTPVPNQDIVLVPDPESTYFQIKLGLSQPLYTWGKLNASRQAAEHGLAAATLNHTNSQNELKRDLHKAYYGFILAVLSEEILVEAESLLSQIVADREKSFNQGSINLESLLEAKQNLAGITTQKQITHAGKTQALATIRYLTGNSNITIDTLIREDLQIPIPDPEMLPSPEDLPRLVEMSRQQNPRLGALAHQVSQAENGLFIQKRTNSLYPDLGLSIDLEVSGQRFPGIPNWFDSWDTSLTLSLGTKIRIFDGGKHAGTVKQAEIQSRQAAAGLLQLEQSIELQIASSIENLTRSYQEYLLGLSRLELAREQEKNARVSFENQLITREQYQGAQILLINRKLEQVSHRFSIQNALADLEFILGQDVE